MSNDSLYKLVHKIEVLDEMLDDETAPTEQIAKALIELDGQISVKAENTLDYMLNIAAARDGAKNEAKRLKEYADMLENRYNRLKDGLLYAMKTLNKDKIITKHGEIKIKFNPPAVQIDDVALLPPKYTREKISIEPNKVEIKKALKAGEEVAGASLTRKEVLVF